MITNIIVVTYNAYKWIDKCIKSILSSSIKTNIIIIDNSSSDDTVSKIKSDYKEVELIELKENLGFGKANNIGLKKALEAGADYVLLLNQDAWVYENTMEGLIEISKKYPEYGIFSPVHLANKGQSLDNNFTNYINGHSCPDFLADLILKREIKDIYETNFVNAACWLITSKCLENVGGFDPLYLHYAEDDDYINRIKYHGLKVGICPNYYCVHERPQINKNSFARSFGQRLFGFKDLSKELPAKNYFLLKWIEATLKDVIFRSNPNESKVWAKLLKEYDEINSNRELAKKKGATFLINE